MKFINIIKLLEKVSKDLKSKKTNVKELDDAVYELKKHTNNIEAIETNIKAIKEEVIEPIKKELNQNKISGRFSIVGFVVGIIGLSASVYTIFLMPAIIGIPDIKFVQNRLSAVENSVQGKLELIEESVDSKLRVVERSIKTRLIGIEKSVDNKLSPFEKSIDKRLVTIESLLIYGDKPTLKKGEYFVEKYKTLKISDENEKPLVLKVAGIAPYLDSLTTLKAAVEIYMDDRKIGTDKLAESLRRNDRKLGKHNWYDNESLALEEGDLLDIGIYSIKILKIFDTQLNDRTIGDKVSGVKIKIENRKE